MIDKLVDKICSYIVKMIRKKMPEIDDEKAEVILYGIQLIIGEIPKLFIIFGISILLEIGWYMLFAYIAIIPYRAASGGFHLKSHLGCIIGTSLFYYGNIFLSKSIVIGDIERYILVAVALIFGIFMVSLYAPADTENVPIISKKERKNKKIMSYITLVLTLAVSLIIKDNTISNILIIGVIIQTITITRVAYKLTNNKYGYEEYLKEAQQVQQTN